MGEELGFAIRQWDRDTHREWYFWPVLVVLVVCGTPGKPKVFARDFHLSSQNVLLFPYSIVIGDYYSGDARYLVVNGYSVLQLLLVTNW